MIFHCTCGNGNVTYQLMEYVNYVCNSIPQTPVARVSPLPLPKLPVSVLVSHVTSETSTEYSIQCFARHCVKLIMAEHHPRFTGK